MDVESNGLSLVPEVEAFKKEVMSSPVLRMSIDKGIANIPEGGILHGSNIDEVFRLVSSVCSEPPRFEDKKLVGLPFIAIFTDLMNNKDGQMFFLHPKVNEHLKEVFQVYANMLESPASLKYLNEEEPHGWLSPQSEKYIDWEDYYVDKTQAHWGFKTWNDFFTRKVRPERRPIDQRPNCIVHSSDSHPLFYPLP